MQKSESIIKLTGALIKAKQKFLPLFRNQENPGFKRGNQVSRYADLAAVIEATEGPLLENGLVLTQFPHNEGERVGVQNMLVHESGEFLEHTFTVAIIKQDAQTSVAGITYARRVSMKSILGISDEDDDGNTASRIPPSGNEQKASATTAPKAATQPPAAPKAEIPAALPSSSGPVAEAQTVTATAGSAEMPTETHLTEFRKKFKTLCDDLANAGLKAGKGLPINRKVRAYLLMVTEAPDTDKISLSKWNGFFAVTDSVRSLPEGLKQLVVKVNEANGIKKETK